MVKLNHLILGTSTFQYKGSMILFGCFGHDTQPKILLDLSADLSEIFISKFGQ